MISSSDFTSPLPGANAGVHTCSETLGRGLTGEPGERTVTIYGRTVTTGGEISSPPTGSFVTRLWGVSRGRPQSTFFSTLPAL
jgi:hypothetical protein